jgi:hypothetical protein
VRVLSIVIVAVVLDVSTLYGHEGWGVVVDDRWGVVVADIPGNTIWRIAGGKVEPLARNIHSHDLTMDEDGAVYGSNPEPSGDLSSVWRIDPSGRFSYVLPPVHGSPLGLQSFLRASDGSIYSASRYDHRRPAVVLLCRRTTGEIVTIAGAATAGGAARFTGIDGMREAADGTLVIADGVHLRTVSRDGRVSTVTGPLTERRWDEDLLGISSVRGDLVYVADHAGRRVLRVNWKTGHVARAATSGFLWSPAGVEHKPHGLYILEHLRPPLSILGDLQIGPYLKVRKIDPGGASSTLAVIWGRRSARAAAVAVSLVLIAVAVLFIRRARRRAAG